LYPDAEKIIEEEMKDEKNLPAQEAPEKARARLYEENGYQERQKGSRTPPR